MTYNNPAQEGLERKIKSWSEQQLGQQIGACLNKAVDIAIAKDELTKKFIMEWVDILFEIGKEKKVKEIISYQDNQPQPYIPYVPSTIKDPKGGYRAKSDVEDEEKAELNYKEEELPIIEE